MQILFRTLSAAGVAICLSVSAASAADFAQPAPIRSSAGGWGAGPLTMSLVEVARNEGPVRGVEPTVAFVAPVRSTMPVIPIADAVTAAPTRFLAISQSQPLAQNPAPVEPVRTVGLVILMNAVSAR